MSPCEANEQESPEYRSPARVLARFFQKSRDLWKAKYQKLQERMKAFRTDLRDLRRSRDRWRARAEALEQENKQLRSQSQRQATQSPPAPSRQRRPILTQLSS